MRAGDHTISLSVEAKSGESLDRLVGDWLAAPAASETSTPQFHGAVSASAVEVTGQQYNCAPTASALVQADRFGARCAVLLIHSFGGHSDDKSRKDFRLFTDAMACVPAINTVAAVGRQTKLPLLIGWVSDAPAAAEMVARALPLGPPTP